MRSLLSVLGGLFVAGCTGTIDTGGDPMETDPDGVVVFVRDGFTPQANVNVVFQNADDSVVAEVVTGPDGRAFAEMAAGGSVTVVRTFEAVDPAEPPPPAEVFTYLGVSPGDVLQVGRPVDELGTPSAITVKVPEAAAGTVKVTTPCGTGQGEGPYIAVTLTTCPAEVAFLVTDGNQQSFVKHAAVTENVDLSAEVLLDRTSATVSTTNVPADITQVAIDKRIEAGTYRLYASGEKRVEAQAQTVTMPTLLGVDEVLVARLVRGTGGTQIISTRAPFVAGPTVVDAGALARIPYPTELDATPSAITWTEDGTGSVDFVLTTFDVTREDPATPVTPLRFVRTIVAPYTAGTARVPQLPVTTYNPADGDQIAVGHALVAATGGYDAARANVFGVASLTDLAPMGGRVTISYTGRAPAGM